MLPKSVNHSGLSILMHGAIPLTEVTSYDKLYTMINVPKIANGKVTNHWVDYRDLIKHHSAANLVFKSL